jgi:hypothetical protein
MNNGIIPERVKFWDGTEVAAINTNNRVETDLEELGSGISVNSQSQLKVTIYDSSGNELLNSAANSGNIKIGNGTRSVEIDSKLDALRIADEKVLHINSGVSFHCEAYASALASAGTLILAFKTPNTTKWGHLTISGFGTDDFKIELDQGATWDTSSGSQQSVYNRDRNSATTTDMLEDTTGSFADNNALNKDPTSYSAGTILETLYAVSGEIIGQKKWILDQDTQYAVVLTNLHSGAANFQLRLDWNEFTNAS